MTLKQTKNLAESFRSIWEYKKVDHLVPIKLNISNHQVGERY